MREGVPTNAMAKVRWYASNTSRRERCRPDARLIRGETIQRKNFFAKTS